MATPKMRLLRGESRRITVDIGAGAVSAGDPVYYSSGLVLAAADGGRIDAVMVDDKGHDPGDTIVRRVCDHGEAADHSPFHEVIVSSPGGIFALCLQDFKKIPVVGYGLAICFFVSFPGGTCKEITKRAFLFTWFCLPEKTVLLAR